MAQAFYGPTFEWDGQRYVFDRRPVGVILVHRSLRLLSLLGLGAAFLYMIYGVPAPEGLSVPAYRALCIFGLAVVLWIGQPIPLAITSLLIFALVPVLGVLEAAAAYAAFGNRVVFFILGAFILAGVLMSSGLSSRITLMTLRAVGNNPRRLVTTIFCIGAFFSCLMSEHAVAAMLFPIVVQIAVALKLRQADSRFGKALFFAMAWGCIIGGITTVLGGGRGPLAIGMLEEYTKGAQTIHFGQFTLYNFPMVLLLMAIGWAFLRGVIGNDLPDLDPAVKTLNQRLLQMGRRSPRENAVGIVMILTVLFWVLLGEDVGLANIAIASTVLLFVLKLTHWREIEDNVNWGIILMYGGAICLGTALDKTGAAKWAASQLIGGMSSPYMLLGVLGAASLVLTAFMSNSAVIAVLLPICLSMSDNLGIDLRAATMTVVLPSNIDFTLPMGTPAMAIAFSSGFIRVRDSMRWGLMLSACGLLSYLVLLHLYWPLIGLMNGH